MNQAYDVVVVGGGPAGIQAARMIKMKQPAWRVAMFRPERASMVYCAIPYALEGIVHKDKVLKSDRLVTDVGIELLRERIVRIDTTDRWVESETGDIYSFNKLLYVPGSRSMLPPVPGADLDGIFTVKTEADMESILSRLESGARRAVVIGAGAIGLEQAQALRSRGLEVHLVDLADRILPHMADEDMTTPLKEELTRMGIQLHLSTRVSAFSGSGAVSVVVLDSGVSLPVTPGIDLVVVSVGMVPVTDLLDGQVETTRDGIRVDAGMRTSIPYIFAAGDVVQGWSGIDGKPLGGRLATNAVPMAKVAAINILGGHAEYAGFFNGVATVIGEMRIGGTGFTERFAESRGIAVIIGMGETTSRFPMMPGARPVRVKLVAEKATGRIIGGQVTGYEAVAERIDVITLAIQQKMTADQMTRWSYSAQPWQTFFPASNAILQAASDITDKLNSVK
ncbi:FAD-dependent oxidoreductase [bacterium]|nr:FAD-dependent oxidoreductase [candidate division CSSED10-310 bacterium]